MRRSDEAGMGTAILVLFALAAAGCGGEGEGEVEGPAAGLEAVVRDSAGVRVVEVGASPERVPGYADVSAEPELELGALEGPEAVSFERISDVRSLPDGGIVVADGGADELRVFTPDGAHVRTFGGRGEGPGEFGHLASIVGDPGDTVRVWDNVRQRLTVFTLEGEVVRTVPFSGDDPYGRVHLMQPLTDGTLVVRSGWSALREDATLEPSDFRVVRDSVVLRRLTASGELLDTLAVLPGPESIEAVTVTPRGEGVAVGTRSTSRPLGRSSDHAVVGDHVVGGANDRFELRVWRPDGSVETLLRWPALNRPVTDADFDELRSLALAEADEVPESQRPRVREMIAGLYDDFSHPDTWPAFAELHPDGDDRFWVEEYTERGDPEHWWVFRLDGSLRGTVAVPSGFHVTEIGPDHLLGWVRDELDVPYVRRYRLERR